MKLSVPGEEVEFAVAIDERNGKRKAMHVTGPQVNAKGSVVATRLDVVTEDCHSLSGVVASTSTLSQPT